MASGRPLRSFLFVMYIYMYMYINIYLYSFYIHSGVMASGRPQKLGEIISILKVEISSVSYILYSNLMCYMYQQYHIHIYEVDVSYVL